MIKRGIRHTLILLLVSFLLNIVLLIVLYYMIMNRPVGKFYATDVDNKELRLIPLSKPNLSKEALIEWSVQAVTSAFTYDFVNYNRALRVTANYFTQSGWNDYLTALDNSESISVAKSKKVIISAVPVGAAVIIQEGAIRGRYAWKVQVPMLINYNTASDQVQKYLTVTVLVSRIPTTQNPKGIGIAQFVATG